ncbi:TPA: MFS transporter [Legionella feeleii]
MPVHPEKAYQWIASLYFLQSIPYFVVTVIAILVYQQQGMDNCHAALISSLLILPWAIKPVLAPFLEQKASKKKLTIFNQLLMAFVFLLLAISNETHFIVISTLLFIGLAFFAALHDVVSDGLYLLNLDGHRQKKYVPLRTVFYQFGRLFVKGGLLVLAGRLAIEYKVNVWSLFFSSLCLIVLLFALYHWVKIPEKTDHTHQASPSSYLTICKSLLCKRELYPALWFLFLYNFSDAQMQKIIPLFLLDKLGMALSLSQFATIYGIGGSLALMSGVFISGLLISRYTLADCLKNTTILLLMGHLLFFFLSFDEHNIYFIYAAILVNQLVFGLVNGCYMGYLLATANKGVYPMSMYSICTAVMASSYAFFGALSGLLEQALGYSWFFFYIFLANILLVVMTCWRMNQHG